MNNQTYKQIFVLAAKTPADLQEKIEKEIEDAWDNGYYLENIKYQVSFNDRVLIQSYCHFVILIFNPIVEQKVKGGDK